MEIRSVQGAAMEKMGAMVRKFTLAPLKTSRAANVGTIHIFKLDGWDHKGKITYDFQDTYATLGFKIGDVNHEGRHYDIDELGLFFASLQEGLASAFN